MVQLEGRALLGAVTALTCMGFLLIGFDNGLMGGLVGAPAFNGTFNTPGAEMVGLIVAIYEGKCNSNCRRPRLTSDLTQLDASSAL